jgi:hypothetical protein
MFPSSELDPLIDFVVYRLRTAEWISGYQFQKGRGYILEWTAKRPTARSSVAKTDHPP